MSHNGYYLIDILNSLAYTLHKQKLFNSKLGENILVIIKNKSIPVDIQFVTLSLIVLCLIFMSRPAWAGTFYLCTDKAGSEIIVDSPVEGYTCAPLGSFEEKKNTQKEDKKAVSPDDKITKVIVDGNQVLVPVTLVHGRDEVNINLLMDTGATRTAIHTEVANRLYLNLLGAAKAKAEIVGGGIIEAKIFKMDSLKVGPNIFNNHEIFIVPHEGKAASFDGLLGMDVLGKVSYRLDLAKQLIYWE